MSVVVNNVEATTTTDKPNLRASSTDGCKIRTNIVKTNFKYEKSPQFQLDKELFTFKPKLNPKSTLLAQNLISFYERQNLHSRKQLEMVSEKKSIKVFLKIQNKKSFMKITQKFFFRETSHFYSV